MVAETLSEADLAASLPEVLERVRAGARFAVERDGEVIATISPPNAPSGITSGAFVATYRDRPRPDDRFADDLEAIQKTQPWIPDLPERPA